MRLRSVFLPPAGYRGRASPRRRATALVLAVVAVALLLVMLLELGRVVRSPSEPSGMAVTFQLAPAPRASKERRPAAASKPKTRSAATAGRPETPPVPTPSPRPTPPPKLAMSHDEFAATDISNLGHHDAAEQGDSGAASGASASVYGPSEGPVGRRLFNAEWYVEPSRVALATYLPPGGAPAGWGMIACRTVERYHVEDCRELGESPAGSGLSRALRQAAWQFLVRPPRIGGKAMVGAWVRIRFDFTVRKGGEDEPEAR